MAGQIKAWQAILPSLIKKFSRIEDYRRTKSVKHKMVVLMIDGLFAFVFRLSSRREMKRVLTGIIVHQHYEKYFQNSIAFFKLIPWRGCLNILI